MRLPSVVESRSIRSASSAGRRMNMSRRNCSRAPASRAPLRRGCLLRRPGPVGALAERFATLSPRCIDPCGYRAPVCSSWSTNVARPLPSAGSRNQANALFLEGVLTLLARRCYGVRAKIVCGSPPTRLVEFVSSACIMSRIAADFCEKPSLTRSSRPTSVFDWPRSR